MPDLPLTRLVIMNAASVGPVKALRRKSNATAMKGTV
jgi:hypothetical protein